MGKSNTTDPLEVDALIEQQAFPQARKLLEEADAEDDAIDVMRIKLGLREGSLPPGLAMQRLVQLMRRDPSTPFAKSLYQEASRLSFDSRASSTAHSHPPPPVAPKK